MKQQSTGVISHHIWCVAAIAVCVLAQAAISANADTNRPKGIHRLELGGTDN